jgi:hypothetical protein
MPDILFCPARECTGRGDGQKQQKHAEMLETGVVLEPEPFGSGASTKKPTGAV